MVLDEEQIREILRAFEEKLMKSVKEMVKEIGEKLGLPSQPGSSSSSGIGEIEQSDSSTRTEIQGPGYSMIVQRSFDNIGNDDSSMSQPNKIPLDLNLTFTPSPGQLISKWRSGIFANLISPSLQGSTFDRSDRSGNFQLHSTPVNSTNPRRLNFLTTTDSAQLGNNEGLDTTELLENGTSLDLTTDLSIIPEESSQMVFNDEDFYRMSLPESIFECSSLNMTN